MADFANLVLGVDTRGLKKGERALDDTTRAGRKTERATDGAAAGMGRLGATSGGVAAAGMRKFAVAATAAVGALVAVVAAGAGLNKFVSATVEADAAQAQLAAALLSTGGAAGKTIGQLNAHAAALQGVTKFGDEATNAMQGVLLTFTQIQGGTFDKATVATMDLATAMGTDLKAAALQVGKALNDPVLGMTALSRSGIQFTEAQKDVVKAMVATNDIAGAQGIILGELEKQFGGSAAAARDTLGGALAALGNSFGDLFELSGPATEKLRASIDGLIETITTPSFVAGLQNIGALLFGIAGAALKVVGAFGVLIGTASNFLALGSATNRLAIATDNVTLAMGDEIKQANALFTLMESGKTMTQSAAIATLSQAEAHLRNAAAKREEVDATLALRQAQLALEYQSAQEALKVIKAGTDGYYEQEAAIVEIINSMGALREIQQGVAGDFQEATAEVERIKAAIAGAVDGMVVFDGQVITAISLSERLANISGGINFNNANASAAELAKKLGISLTLARTIAAIGGSGGAAGPDGAIQQVRAAFNMQDLIDQGVAVRKVFEATTKSIGGGGGGGGLSGASKVAATELKAMAKEIERLEFDADPVKKYNAEIAKLQKLSKNGLSDGAMAKAVSDLNDELIETHPLADGVESAIRGMADGGIKSIKDLVSHGANLIKQFLIDMVVRFAKTKLILPMMTGGGGNAANMAMQAAGGGGVGGGAAATTLMGGAGAALAAGGSLVGVTGLLGGVGAGAGMAASAFASGGFSALGGTIAAQTAAATAAGASMAGLGAALGAVALPLAAVFAVVSFFKSKTKTIDEGIKGVISMEDAAFQSFQRIEKSRFFGLSKKRSTITKTLSAGPMDQAAFLVRESVVGAAESLGVSSSIFDGFTHRFSLSLKGLDEAAKSAAISKEFARMGESLANLVPHIDSVNQLFAVAQNRVALTDRLLQAQGKTEELTAIMRGREMDATNEHNKALLAQIFAAEDAAAAVNKLSEAMNANENAFATGVDFRRGLSRAANNIAYSPEKSQAEMLAELKSLNARMDVLQSTSEITANSSSQTAENTDYTNALTLEAAT